MQLSSALYIEHRIKEKFVIDNVEPSIDPCGTSLTIQVLYLLFLHTVCRCLAIDLDADKWKPYATNFAYSIVNVVNYRIPCLNQFHQVLLIQLQTVLHREKEGWLTAILFAKYRQEFWKYVIKTEDFMGVIIEAQWHIYASVNSLVQLLDWRRTGSKPWPEPMTCNQLDLWEQTNVKLESKYDHFFIQKMH